MIKAEQSQYRDIHTIYCNNKFFFPLISAVLLNEQEGTVYVDDPISPKQVYVEHAFGFAQIFGQCVEEFEQQLESYFFTNKNFIPNKIRLYANYLPIFLNGEQYNPLRSYRQRFTVKEKNFCKQTIHYAVDARPVDVTNVDCIANQFGLVTRFWRNCTDFVQKSRAIVVYYEGKPASICYSAAEANGYIEIDVLTLPEYRNRGLAKLAVMNFVKRCFELSLTPLWDCFANNSASVRLSKSIGFRESNEPYPFFTINK